MNSYLLLKYLHELAAFWFVTGIAGRQLVRHLARCERDVQRFALLTQVAGRFESLMVIPGNLLVIVLGVLLAWCGGWPILGFLQGADANWLLVSNLLLLVGLVLVPLVYVPRGKVFGQALQEALAAGEVTKRLTAILQDPVVKWAHQSEYAALLLILVLMVFKPF